MIKASKDTFNKEALGSAQTCIVGVNIKGFKNEGETCRTPKSLFDYELMCIDKLPKLHTGVQDDSFMGLMNEFAGKRDQRVVFESHDKMVMSGDEKTFKKLQSMFKGSFTFFLTSPEAVEAHLVREKTPPRGSYTLCFDA